MGRRLQIEVGCVCAPRAPCLYRPIPPPVPPLHAQELYKRVIDIADKYDCPLVRERSENWLVSRCLKVRPL